MAKIKQKKLVVDLAPGVDFWDWYQRDAAPDVADWIGGIDGGDTADRFATTEEPEVNIPQVEGTESDPATFPGWTAVPLDLSPPAPATGGAIIDA
jgi:hypothetical protein